MNMEHMFTKLKSTLSYAASNAASNAVSIASQVSNYLPGNPVTREYEATAHIASAGTGLSWKVYSGYKKTTRQDVSIFVFEKRSLDKFERQEREYFLENLKRGVNQLTRIRHPQILTVEHQLEESRDSLAFVTEPILASLANIIGKNSMNMPSPIPSELQDYVLKDIEIKYGLMQVCAGLQFLHNSVKLVHCCVSPQNVIVNAQCTWKLFGFDFCIQKSDAKTEEPRWSIHGASPSCLPPLSYLAPECLLSPSIITTASDLFSLGSLVTAVFNGGRSHMDNKGDVEGYKRAWGELSRLSSHQLVGVPDALKEDVRQCLSVQSDNRPDALKLSQNVYFDDFQVKTLSYLDQIFQWDNVQKSQFYKGLPQLIPQLPHRIALLKIVPALVQESVNPSMVPFILPVVLQIAEKSTAEEFTASILPHLKPIMKITEPIQVMVQILQKLPLLLNKTPPSDLQSDVLPLLYRALETDTPTIQEMCVASLPESAKFVDAQTMKAHLLPRIQKLCLSTSTLSVRVSCLVCVGRLLPHLDKWLLSDVIVPFIIKMPSKEAPVIMAVVGILKVSMQCKNHELTKEAMAGKILPFLFPLTIENSLSPTQHATLMGVVRQMVDKVEEEHKNKLQYLNSIQQEQKSLQQILPGAPMDKAPLPEKGESDPVDEIFGNLDLGKFSPSNLKLGTTKQPVTPMSLPLKAPTVSSPMTPMTPAAVTQANTNKLKSPPMNQQKSFQSLNNSNQVNKLVNTPMNSYNKVSSAANVPMNNSSAMNMPMNMALNNSSVMNMSMNNSNARNMPMNNSSSMNMPMNNSSSMNMPMNNSNSMNMPMNNSNSMNMPMNNSSSMNMPMNNSSSMNMPMNNSSSRNMPMNNSSSMNMPMNNSNIINPSINMPMNMALNNANSMNAQMNRAMGMPPSGGLMSPSSVAPPSAAMTASNSSFKALSSSEINDLLS